MKINQFITKESKKPEIETQKPKIEKNLAPKEPARLSAKKKKKKKEEERQLQVKKMKGYWSKLNQRKLADQACNNQKNDSMPVEVTPVAGRLIQIASRCDNSNTKRCTDNFMERSFPVTAGEISQSKTFKSENSTRIEESENYNDLSQETD